MTKKETIIYIVKMRGDCCKVTKSFNCIDCYFFNSLCWLPGEDFNDPGSTTMRYNRALDRLTQEEIFEAIL